METIPPLPLFNRLNVLLKMAGCSVFGFFFVLPFLRLDVTIGATQSLFFSKKRKKKKKKSESRCAWKLHLKPDPLLVLFYLPLCCAPSSRFFHGE